MKSNNGCRKAGCTAATAARHAHRGGSNGARSRGACWRASDKIVLDAAKACAWPSASSENAAAAAAADAGAPKSALSSSESASWLLLSTREACDREATIGVADGLPGSASEAAEEVPRPAPLCT